MAEYDNPRPTSQPVGSTDQAVAKDNLITYDKLVNSTDLTVENRKGAELRTLAGNEEYINERITAAVAVAGYQIVGDFADSPKVQITKENQVYTSKSIVGNEDALWRTNQALPYTPTGSVPTLAPELGKWVVVAQGELKSIARSLNVLDSQVIYSTDTTTVLDDVLYIYDASAQVIWGKPSSVGAGEFIDNISGATLTTDTAAIYTLVNINTGDTFSSIESMVLGVAVNRAKVLFSAGQVVTIESYYEGESKGRHERKIETGAALGNISIDIGGGLVATYLIPDEGINVWDLGALDDYDGDSGVVLTDSIQAFNDARDLAKRLTGRYRSIIVNGWSYYLSGVWNLTSEALDGAFNDRRQGLNVYFENRTTQFRSGTQLFGGGGITSCVVNTSGSDGISTYNMGIRRAINTLLPLVVGARLGLLQARTSGAGQTEWAGDQKHDNLFIDMGSDTSFADNYGTIGYVNLAGEETNCHNIQVWANTPIIHTSTKSVIKTGSTFDNTANDTIDLQQFSSQTLTLSGSNTVFNYSGQGRVIAYDYVSPPVLMNNVATLDLGSMFMQLRESEASEQTGASVTVGETNWAIDSWNCFGFKHFGSIEGAKMYHMQRRAFEDFDINIALNEDATAPGDTRSSWILFDDGGAYTLRRGKAIIRNNNVAGAIGGKRGDESTTSELNFDIRSVNIIYSRDYGDGVLDKRVLRKMLSECSVKYDDFAIGVPIQGVMEFEQSGVNINRRNDPAVDVLDIEFPSYQLNLGAATATLKVDGTASNVSLGGGGAASVGYPAVNSFEFTANAARIHNAQEIYTPALITVSNGDGAQTLASANIINGIEATITSDNAENKVTISLHPDTGAGANNANVFVNIKCSLMWSGGVEEGPKISRLA